MKKVLASIMIFAAVISAVAAAALGCCYLRDFIKGVQKIKSSLQSKTLFRGMYEEDDYEQI